MPIRPEFHYYYIYLKNHIEKTHRISCVRADHSIRQGAFMDKIRRYIKDADLILADVSGGNPNVLYELGIAHQRNKRVILMTRDAVEAVPSDIRHLDMIRYDLTKEDDLVRLVDRALERELGTLESDLRLYDRAQTLLSRFSVEYPGGIVESKKATFLRRLRSARERGSFPPRNDSAGWTLLLLQMLVEGRGDYSVMDRIQKWSLTASSQRTRRTPRKSR